MVHSLDTNVAFSTIKSLATLFLTQWQSGTLEISSVEWLQEWLWAGLPLY